MAKKGRKINTTLPSIFRLGGRRGNSPHKMPLSKTVNKNIVWTPLEDVILVGPPHSMQQPFSKLARNTPSGSYQMRQLLKKYCFFSCCYLYRLPSVILTGSVSSTWTFSHRTTHINGFNYTGWRSVSLPWVEMGNFTCCKKKPYKCLCGNSLNLTKTESKNKKKTHFYMTITESTNYTHLASKCILKILKWSKQFPSPCYGESMTTLSP